MRARARALLLSPLLLLRFLFFFNGHLSRGRSPSSIRGSQVQSAVRPNVTKFMAIGSVVFDIEQISWLALRRGFTDFAICAPTESNASPLDCCRLFFIRPRRCRALDVRFSKTGCQNSRRRFAKVNNSETLIPLDFIGPFACSDALAKGFLLIN